MTRIIQSFWSKPIFENSSFNNQFNRLKGGWIDNKSHMMSWALSSLLLRRFYDDVVLITDDFGKELLIDILKLPYTEVNTELNGINSYHSDLWALGKIYSYGCQNVPFIHVDGDVFIFNKFSSEIENSQLVCQNFDIDCDDYYNILDAMDSKEFVYPYVMKTIRTKQKKLIASNAGILGGNMISFFKEFSTMAFSFVDTNIHKLHDFYIPSFNIIFEQYLFYTLAKYNNIEITPYFKTPDIDFSPTRCIRFQSVPYRSSYIHMIAKTKQNILLVDQMKSLLRINFPEYFFRIKGFSENMILNV